MKSAQFSPFLRTPVSRRHPLAALLSLVLLSAWAFAGDLRYQASHVTSRSPDQIWGVLTDYKNICSTCKYKRDDLVEVRKIPYQATDKKFYTWSHVTSTVKDVKYFTEVTVTRKSDGNFIFDNRQLDNSDSALIKILEEKTGLKHSPAFDRGNTHSVTEILPDGKTKLTQTVTLTVSGMLAMWEGRVLSSMKKSVEVTFRLLGK